MENRIQALRVACVLLCCATMIAFAAPQLTSARPIEEAPKQTNAIANGDFEAGAAGWNASDNTITNNLPAPITAHSGSYAAAIADTRRGSGVTQAITITVATPYLSYWVWSASQESICSLKIFVTDVSFNVSPNETKSINDPKPVCTRTNNNGWEQRFVDLSTAIGQQASVSFRIESSDLFQNSVVYMDDISLVAAPTPAATATPTAKGIFIPIAANGRSTAATSTPVPTSTPLPTTTPIPTPLPITNDIQNGTFERGPFSWTQFDSANRQLIVQNSPDITPRSGSWLARFDVGTNTLATIREIVQLDATPQALRYYYFTKSINDCSGESRFQVYANDTLVDSKLICGSGNTNQWTTGYASLSQFEGQTVTLTFRVVNGQPGANPGEFIAVDDVSLEPLD